jgi:hypothetical protein
VSQSDVHAPDDLLALHATGDPLPPDMDQHVASCSQCRGELSQWSSLVATGRTTTRADVPSEPSPHVWQAIAGEVALGRSSVAAEPAEQRADVISLDSRRRWSTSWLVAASVAGIVGGAALATGGVALTGSSSDPAPVAAAPVVAKASLAALPQHQGDGAAEIIETDTGTELVVDVSDLSAGEGFYEVWLIDPETFQMIGLGALTDTSGRFPIPDGLDLSRYTVVDVSLEPLDGDPVHSTDSVVRGELST